MQTLLAEITTLLATASALPVHVSAPVPNAEALFVWPWRMDLDETLRTARVPSRTARATPQPSQARIQFMLIAQQADRSQSLATLLACARVLEANPVVRSGSAEGRVVLASLPNGDLCDVFRASGVVMQPCLNYTLSLTSPP